MARIRTIKPEFFTSESVLTLSPLARLFFIGLWCESDRDGLLKWKPKTLKFRYLPADNVKIEKLCDELEDEGLIIIYSVDGVDYCEIPGFKNHQVINNREKDSVIPSRVNHASTTRESGRKEGKEGKGKEGKEGGSPDSEESGQYNQHESNNKSRSSSVPYELILKLYTDILVDTDDPMSLVRVKSLTTDRKTKIRQYWKANGSNGLEGVEAYFRYIWDNRKSHSWIFGCAGRDWKADIAYLLRENTVAKARENTLGNWRSEQ